MVYRGRHRWKEKRLACVECLLPRSTFCRACSCDWPVIRHYGLHSFMTGKEASLPSSPRTKQLLAVEISLRCSARPKGRLEQPTIHRRGRSPLEGFGGRRVRRTSTKMYHHNFCAHGYSWSSRTKRKYLTTIEYATLRSSLSRVSISVAFLHATRREHREV